MSPGYGSELERTPGFSRNAQLEVMLKEINASLWIAEKKVLENNQESDFPLILVMGAHRSGTTLFLQWLANTGLVAYPTNLLSRFYQAPIIGAKIQLLLTDARYNFRDELGEFVQQAEYKSENGKTRGVLAPNEFWYFWRRFLAEPSRDVWSDDELRQTMDVSTMKAELAGMMDVFQKPFAAKGMLFNYNIPFLDSLFDNALFVQIQRDPFTNVASVLEARKRQLGSEADWYSFKIPEYDQLKDLDPITQAAGQVHYINRAISRGLEKVMPTRKMLVPYEEFCAKPEAVYEEMMAKLGCNVEPYRGEQRFRTTREVVSERQDAIKRALAQFS